VCGEIARDNYELPPISLMGRGEFKRGLKAPLFFYKWGGGIRGGRTLAKRGTYTESPLSYYY
jgi:hypothetical protein